MVTFNLHRLRLLRELKVRGTMTRVAEALAYSPSAVSQQISLLEGEVGVRLLEPVGRNVRLTPQGEILVRHAETILSQLDRAEAELAASISEVSGTLKIASLQTVALSLVPSVISALARRFPALRVEVTDILPDQTLPVLTSHHFDLVIGEEYPGQELTRPPMVHFEDFLQDPLYLLIPKDWGKETASGIGDLASRAWAMEERGKPAREWAVSRCRQEGFEPDIRYESNDLLVHVKLVQAGHAVTFTPGLLWQTVARTDRLLGPPGAPTRKIFTAVREGMQDRPDIKAFRAEILALTTKVLADRRSFVEEPSSLESPYGKPIA